MAGISEAEGFTSGLVDRAIGHIINATNSDDPVIEKRVIERTAKVVKIELHNWDFPLGQQPPEDQNSITMVFQPVPGTDFDPLAPGEFPPQLIGSFSILTSDDRVLVTVDGLAIRFADLFGPGADTPAPVLLLDGPTRYRGNSGAGEQDGGTGNDTMAGGGGDDTLNGGAGADDLNGDAGQDVLKGGGGADRLFGGAEADDLSGKGGGDLLAGGDGDDTLSGGGGDDRLTGGFGKDRLTGGNGADSFVYQTLPALNGQESGPGNRDTITDFEPGVDVIDVGIILVQPFEFLGLDGVLTGAGQIAYRLAGADTIVDISTDADADVELSIRLLGHHVLTADDFIR